jgi:hypothetical protein
VCIYICVCVFVCVCTYVKSHHVGVEDRARPVERQDREHVEVLHGMASPGHVYACMYGWMDVQREDREHVEVLHGMASPVHMYVCMYVSMYVCKERGLRACTSAA